MIRAPAWSELRCQTYEGARQDGGGQPSLAVDRLLRGARVLYHDTGNGVLGESIEKPVPAGGQSHSGAVVASHDRGRPRGAANITTYRAERFDHRQDACTDAE